MSMKNLEVGTVTPEAVQPVSNAEQYVPGWRRLLAVSALVGAAIAPAGALTDMQLVHAGALVHSTEVDVLGKVRPYIKIGSKTSEAADGALVADESYPVKIFGKNIKYVGLRVDVPIAWLNRLDVNDITVRAAGQQIAGDPEPTVARITDKAINNAEWDAALGAGVPLALELIVVGGIAYRYKRYASYTAQRRQETDDNNRALRIAMATTSAVASVALVCSGVYVAIHNDNRTIQGDMSFSGTQLHGVALTGNMANWAEPIANYLSGKDGRLADTIRKNIDAAIDGRSDLELQPGWSRILAIDDLQNDEPMADGAGETAKLLKANAITMSGDVGDSFFASNVANALTYRAGGIKIEFAKGLHDVDPSAGILAETLDWGTADGETHEVAGLRILLLDDPYQTTVDRGGASNELRNPDIDEDKFVDDAVSKIEAEKPDVVVIHDYRLAKLIASKTAGLFRLMITGRSYDELGAQPPYEDTAGNKSIVFIGGSGGGHADTDLSFVPEKNATYEIFDFNIKTGEILERGISVTPAGEVTIATSPNMIAPPNPSSTNDAAPAHPKHQITG